MEKPTFITNLLNLSKNMFEKKLGENHSFIWNVFIRQPNETNHKIVKEGYMEQEALEECYMALQKAYKDEELFYVYETNFEKAQESVLQFFTKNR